MTRDQIKAPFGGHFFATFGHQHHGVRLGGDRDLDHLWCSGHLQVEFDVHQLPKPPNVFVLDVTAIFAQMDGDAVGTPKMGLGRRPDGIGLPRPPGLADGGHMVDVDTKLNHVGERRAGINVPPPTVPIDSHHAPVSYTHLTLPTSVPV